jgi:hypothetical protein
MSGLHDLLHSARLWRGLVALVGVTLASVAPTQAQTLPPSGAPAEWVRYAETATATISDWLEEDSAAATRLRAWEADPSVCGDRGRNGRSEG